MSCLCKTDELMMNVYRHHARHRVDLETPVLVILEFVGDVGVGALVVVSGEHPANLLSAHLMALFRQLHVEKLVCELGPVVVGIKDSDHDSSGGA
uniref:Uncharacterized protein n=1 Tax=Lates calcarifer TaxID=8187 RepID=A0A4W6G742_LATCA